MKRFINKYTYQVQWSEEDQVYIGRCIEFPGLAAHGDSSEDALKEIKVVVREVNQMNREKKHKNGYLLKPNTGEAFGDWEAEHVWPEGWQQERVQRAIDFYENQTEDEAVEEDETPYNREY